MFGAASACAKSREHFLNKLFICDRLA